MASDEVYFAPALSRRIFQNSSSGLAASGSESWMGDVPAVCSTSAARFVSICAGVSATRQRLEDRRAIDQ